MEPVVPFPSALAQTQKLAFSVEQLEGVLDEWLLEFANQEWLQEIQDRGEGDVRVVCDLIEQKQSAIWRKHNIDPDSGFRDLGKAKQVFAGHPVCQKIMLACMREEAIAHQCTTGKEQAGPQTVEELKQASLSAFPQMMGQLQQYLQQNPEAARQMSPEQQQQLRQMIMFQQQLQRQQQQAQQNQAEKEKQELSELD